MPDLTFDPKASALILIDLQNGLAAMPLEPHSFAGVVDRSRQIAEALRARGGTIVYVRVDMNDRPERLTDEPSRLPPGAPVPATLSELVPNSGFTPGDLLITKRSWGAFYNTPLDQELRTRNITNILIGGVATNFGVESTARAAADHGYELLFLEDCMSTRTQAAHQFALESIFPRLGRIRTTAQVLEALA